MTKSHILQVKLIDKDLYDTSSVLDYATQGSAAMDLRTSKDFILQKDTTILVGTGIQVYIKDPNIAGLIVPRSGLGHKQGIVLGNLTGLIDSDYTGELMLSIWNRSHEVRYFSRGDRIAQLLLVPVIKANIMLVEEFSNNTDRGGKGFNSSGIK